MKWILPAVMLTLLNGNDIVIQQGNSAVTVKDIDAMVYAIPDHAKAGIIGSPKKMEREIFTLLNLNIVNDYLKKENVQYDVDADLNSDQDVEEFQKHLALDDQFQEAVKSFEIKKLNYKAHQDALKNGLTTEDVHDFAYEHYLVNQKKYTVPEQLNVMMVTLSKSKHSAQETMALLKGLGGDITAEAFIDFAKQHSDDPSFSLNGGDLGWFSQEQFKFGFASHVFDEPKIGLNKQIYSSENEYHILFIKEIKPAVKQSFDEVKDDIYQMVRSQVAAKKFQSIIDQVGEPIQVNEKTAQAIFQRYLFLINE